MLVGLWFHFRFLSYTPSLAASALLALSCADLPICVAGDEAVVAILEA
jgi:hypothetical protein